jgi:hypothetical protein
MAWLLLVSVSCRRVSGAIDLAGDLSAAKLVSAPAADDSAAAVDDRAAADGDDSRAADVVGCAGDEIRLRVLDVSAVAAVLHGRHSVGREAGERVRDRRRIAGVSRDAGFHIEHAAAREREQDETAEQNKMIQFYFQFFLSERGLIPKFI